MRAVKINGRLFKILAMAGISLLLIIALFLGFSSSTRASQEDEVFTYYKSVEVCLGDSLWSIASENYDPASMEINDYINEVMKINHLLEADDIFEGQCLVVPYYSKEFVM